MTVNLNETLDIVLTQEQKDLLIGTLLGDGYMETRTKGNKWSYRAVQGVKQEDYLKHKYEILQSLCSRGINVRPYFDKRTSKVYITHSFQTRTLSALAFYGNLFYQFNHLSGYYKKILPLGIEQFLTPRALAYWYMDDGTLKTKCMVFCTDSFSIDALIIFQKAFLLKFNLEPKLWVHSYAVPHVRRLAFSVRDSKILAELIKPFMLPSFYYKLPL